MCRQAAGTCKAPEQGGHVLQLQQVPLGGCGKWRHQLVHPVLIHVVLHQQGQLLHLKAGSIYFLGGMFQQDSCSFAY